MRTFGTAMATLSVAVLAAALLWPHLAATFLQGLLVALALGYLGAVIQRSHLPTTLTSDSYSPFESLAPRPRSATSPPAVRHLTTLLRAAEDPDAARRAQIPAEVCRILSAEASRRLTEHHGVSPRRSDDEDRIRALVSDATWELLRTVSEKDGAHSGLGSGSLALLETILDDVERL
jgi:hypothetical protein